MKNKFILKNNFNWKINDLDPEIKKQNYTLIRFLFFTAFIFIATLAPLYMFMFIIENNSNLQAYYNYDDSLSMLSSLPKKNEINGLAWSSIGMIFVTLLILIFFKPFVSWNYGSNKRKIIALEVLSVSVILTLLLSALAQYNYAKFQNFFYFEAGTAIENKLDFIQELSTIFKNNLENGIDGYKWQSRTMTWWVMFFQLIIIFAMIVSLQNKIFLKGENEIKNLIVANKKTPINEFKIFKKTDKSISAWIIIIASVIILPQLIFTIIISSDSSNISAILDWTYITKNLFQTYNLEITNEINSSYSILFDGVKTSSYFIDSSLPLIAIGVTISTTFLFISIIIKGNIYGRYTFITQNIILFVELIILIIFSLYAKLEISNLEAIWNSGNGEFFLNIENVLGDDWNNVILLFPINQIDNNFKIEWLNKYEIIAGFIIEIGFIIGSFIIIFKISDIQLFKINKKIKKENKNVK